MDEFRILEKPIYIDNTIDSNSFEDVGIIDVYESMIWSIRYKEPGDFELYTPITDILLKEALVNRLLYSSRFYDPSTNEAHVMFIESVGIEFGTEGGTHIKITGKSLKSILNRRIVWGAKTFKKDTDVQTIIQTLVNEAIISPTIPERRISNFVFDVVEGDWGKTKKETKYDGDSLNNVMDELCSRYKFGYEIVLNLTDKCFHMRLIKPTDHTWEQTDNVPVVFSSDFDNLSASNYLESVENYKNVVYISGERYSDDEIDRFHQTAVYGNASGLERRELFYDASSVSHEKEDGTIYGSETYQKLIEDKGHNELNKQKYSKTKFFDGEVDMTISRYAYNRDYKIGDIAEIINQYGIESKVRITELVLSIDTSGCTFVPTFESLDNENEEEDDDE